MVKKVRKIWKKIKQLIQKNKILFIISVFLFISFVITRLEGSNSSGVNYKEYLLFNRYSLLYMEWKSGKLRLFKLLGGLFAYQQLSGIKRVILFNREIWSNELDVLEV